MVNAVFNRNAKTLLSNDLALYELYKRVFANVNISDYNPSATYSIGDFVWFKYNNKLYLLRCIINNNTMEPHIYIEDGKPSDMYLKQSGWENKNKYLTIFDYGIQQLLESQSNDAYSKHAADPEMHPLGMVSLSVDSPHYIGDKLLKSDMSNANEDREIVFFP